MTRVGVDFPYGFFTPKWVQRDLVRRAEILAPTLGKRGRVETSVVSPAQWQTPGVTSWNPLRRTSRSHGSTRPLRNNLSDMPNDTVRSSVLGSTGRRRRCTSEPTTLGWSGPSRSPRCPWEMPGAHGPYRSAEIYTRMH
jgi:hypothetical protein